MNGGFYTGEIVTTILSIIIVAYFLRKGDRNVLWVFLFGCGAWISAEISLAASGDRSLTITMQLLGGINVGFPVPSILMGIVEGAVPALLAYLFAKFLYTREYKKAVLPLLFVIFYLFQEGVLGRINSLDIPSGLYLSGYPIWNSVLSIRWYFRPSGVGTVLMMTLVGVVALAMVITRRSAHWKFTAYYFLGLVFYVAWAAWTSQAWGYTRFVAVPLISWSAGPSAVLLQYILIMNGAPWLPVAFPYWYLVPGVTTYYWLPATFESAAISYLYDILIEVGGIYIPFLTIPLILRLVKLPENGEAEASRRQGWLSLLFLSVALVPILIVAVWLSSLANNFLGGFVQGLLSGILVIAIGIIVVLVAQVIWRAAKREPIKWW
jgi:hypothetical protein